MPESLLDEIPTEEDTQIYSNKLLKDDLPEYYPYFGTWDFSQQINLEKPKYTIVISEAGSQDFPEATLTEWTENENTLTQTDLLDIEDSQVQDLIFLIRRSGHISNNEKLANKLQTLFNDAKEEDPNIPGITIGSLRNFYYFLLLYTNLKLPTISLTPENNIYASWRDEPNRVFSLHFLQNADVRFVIFKPNNKHPERKIRISGTATTDTLKEGVITDDVLNWIQNER